MGSFYPGNSQGLDYEKIMIEIFSKLRIKWSPCFRPVIKFLWFPFDTDISNVCTLLMKISRYILYYFCLNINLHYIQELKKCMNQEKYFLKVTEAGNISSIISFIMFLCYQCCSPYGQLSTWSNVHISANMLVWCSLAHE